MGEKVVRVVGREDPAYLSHLNTCLNAGQVRQVNVKVSTGVVDVVVVIIVVIIIIVIFLPFVYLFFILYFFYSLYLSIYIYFFFLSLSHRTSRRRHWLET